MYGFLSFLHVVVSLLLIVTILMQASKGGGLAGAFGGGGGTSAIFGGRGAASFLAKVTAVLATAFMLLAIVINFMSDVGAEAPRSLIQERLAGQGAGLPPPAVELPITLPAPAVRDTTL